MNKKITRNDIANAMIAQIGVCGVEAASLTDLIITEIIKAVHAEKCFKASSFGSFIVKAQANRKGRNIKTGDIVDIPGKNTLLFKPSSYLKNRMIKAYSKNNSKQANVYGEKPRSL